MLHALKPDKLIHREYIRGVLNGPCVAYYRSGMLWKVYWRSEAVGPSAPMRGPFDSLDEARRDAEAEHEKQNSLASA